MRIMRDNQGFRLLFRVIDLELDGNIVYAGK